MKSFSVFLFLICNLQVFAQSPLKKEIKNEPLLQQSNQIKKVNPPTFMVDGVLKDLKDTVKITFDLIETIEIVKTDPNYPNGLVKITMKKE